MKGEPIERRLPVRQTADKPLFEAFDLYFDHNAGMKMLETMERGSPLPLFVDNAAQECRAPTVKVKCT